MNWSKAYEYKQPKYKHYMYVMGHGDEYENDLTWKSSKTYGERYEKGVPSNIMTPLLDFTRQYVGGNRVEIPASFRSLESQGYYDDMNLNYTEAQNNYKAKWHKARLYLHHKLNNKVPSEDYSRYIQAVGTYNNLTFLFDQYHIQTYLDEQYPGGIPGPHEVKKLERQGGKWYLDGKEVKATTD